ncbi:hypothetical protein BWK69_00760 [Candidatus Parcubacteria bacterium A4]|nr:MAG: hypothetical protein BWK69_00760 [Candidatus Parcubacteria bacterium A4]
MDDSAKKINDGIKNIAELKKKIETSADRPITEIIETLLKGAICLKSSDIHMEPEENGAKIRLRIDGMLQDAAILDLKVFQKIVSRIKLLSEMMLNVSNRPQDGRFTAPINDSEMEIRTSTLPSKNGESIVLRLLNPKNLIEIEGLGLREDLLEIFQKEIKKPNGMIIVTGPTGSGKTTTLYAVLKGIQNSEIKIITIEDPIEYHLNGISQTQVDPNKGFDFASELKSMVGQGSGAVSSGGKGYDFASGLRSIVRQDPDIILIGEIRDAETAGIAIQAALTGHLVLSTLHTNDAAGTIARLMNLGVKPSDIGPAVNVVIAQRLVRKVCKKCSELKQAEKQTIEKMEKGLKNLAKKIDLPKIDSTLKISSVKGCVECNSTGYKGRVGIFEVMIIDSKMEKFILENSSTSAIEEEAIKNGMTTMKEDGLSKVLRGITTMEEVERVVGE